MSRTLNKVMLIGNVGKDPELKHTPSGIPVTSFNLATTDSWKDRAGNLQEHTDWHSVVAWRGLAEVCHKLVKKGARIYVEGKLQTRNFEDKNGLRKHVVEILIDNMLLLDAKRGKEGGDDKNLDIDNFTMSSFEDEDDFLSILSDTPPSDDDVSIF
ncbi:MAG: single-stranded DNA-binding protein [Ignavibacteria bacterium]|jgi:single-strand DNA-binding protein|nr:single-stranded DNA-binding protein [Ignavibacteria bacterium]